MHPRSRWGAAAKTRRPVGLEACSSVPYVHVDNLVDAIVLAMNTRNRTYNVVEGIGETRDYLRAVGCSTTPGNLRQDFPSTRIRSELGWSPPDRWTDFLDRLAR